MTALDQARNALKAGQPQAALNELAAISDNLETRISVNHLRAQAAMLLPDFDLALSSLQRVTEHLLSHGLNSLPRVLALNPSAPNNQLMTERALQVLVLFHNMRLPVFAFFGTLLGLIREGKMIQGDKDVDLCVWLEYYELAKDLLRQAGFQMATATPPFDNFSTFACPQTGIVFDLMGLRREPEQQRIVGGYWLYGKPAAWQRLSRYDWFELQRLKTPQGIIQLPQAPESILTALYGNWHQPVPEWDSILQARNQLGAGTQYRCFAYLRIIEALRHGKIAKATYLAQAVNERLTDEPQLQQLTELLKQQSNLQHG